MSASQALAEVAVQVSATAEACFQAVQVMVFRPPVAVSSFRQILLRICHLYAICLQALVLIIVAGLQGGDMCHGWT